jgi:hypothetical protein
MREWEMGSTKYADPVQAWINEQEARSQLEYVDSDGFAYDGLTYIAQEEAKLKANVDKLESSVGRYPTFYFSSSDVSDARVYVVKQHSYINGHSVSVDGTILDVTDLLHAIASPATGESRYDYVKRLNRVAWGDTWGATGSSLRTLAGADGYDGYVS